MLAATLRVATPLVLCAMGGLFSERTGIVDIGLEGKMLMAAFFAAATSAVTGSAWSGVAAAILAAEAMALLHGFACITHRGNQVVSGVAINILAAGLTVVLGTAWFAARRPDAGAGGRPAPDAAASSRAPATTSWSMSRSLSVPLTWWSSSAPASACACAPSARSRSRSTPPASRWPGCAIARCCCAACSTGIAGAYLSIAQNAGFSRDMTAGQGFIALAALIFGKWRPVPAFGACLIFGLLDAVAIRLQGVRLPGVGEVPVQLIQALPYLLTVFLLAGFIGRAVAPKATGVPYVKEH